MSLKRLAIAFYILLFVIGCGDKKDSNSNMKDENLTKVSKKVTVENHDIVFKVETVKSETLHIKDISNGFKFEEIKDKAVLVVFFGYRCPPCLREIPRLNELIEQHSDNLEIIAFEVQDLDENQLKSFVEQNSIKYKVIQGTKYMNFISYIQHRAQWQGAIPFLIALNRDGEVEFVQTGGLFKKELEYIYKEITGDKE